MRQSKGLLPAAGNSNNLPPYNGQIAFGIGTPPGLIVYDFDSALGFGKKYADSPTAFTSSAGRGVAWSNDGKSIVFSFNNYPRIAAVPFSSATGIGEWFPDPEPPSSGSSNVPGGTPTEVVMTEDSETFFLSNGGRYGQTAYVYDSSTGIQPRYPWPDPEIGVNCNSCALNPKETRVAYTQQAAPQLYVQGFEKGVGFTTDVFQPSFTFEGSNYDCQFSKDGKSLVVTGSAAFDRLGVWVFEWDDSTGFGAQLASPAVTPDVSGLYACNFSPQGDVIFIGGSGDFPLYAYQYSSSTGIGAKIADPSTPVSSPNTIINFIGVSPGGDLIALGVYGAPFIIVYEWTGSAFGKRYADPSVLASTDPTRRAYQVAFNPAYS